jgi:hypothetical protein
MVVISYCSPSDGQPVFWRNQLRPRALEPIQGGCYQRLVFGQAAPGCREFQNQLASHDPEHGPAQKHPHAQGARLPIGRCGSDLVLIETEQIESKENRQKGRLGGKERTQAKAVDPQVM